jgi:hypothetical protein
MTTTDFEKVATVGKRQDGFRLIEHIDKSRDGWRSLKLTCRRGRKRNWWLGWNGTRMARNADAAKLNERHPDVYGWVIDTMTAAGHPLNR